MRFALVAETRVEAFAGGRAVCPVCGSEVLAKCGSYRDWHWAHQSLRECDCWTEKETEWHRTWKSRFPSKQHEVVLHDEATGDRHIADVRTDHDLVIEFQHSHLDPKERSARERFYKNMVWVVDCARLKGDYPRFLKGKDRLTQILQGHFLSAIPEECFPRMWLESSVPVIFDFAGPARVIRQMASRTCFGACFPVARKETPSFSAWLPSSSWLPSQVVLS